jgi:hypothetical protein
MLCRLLILKEYGVKFEYLPGKKNVDTVSDVLSRLDIDSLKIQEQTKKNINTSLRIRKQLHQ